MPAAKVAPEGSRNDTGWFTRLLWRRWGVPAGDERQHRAPLARFGARDLGAGVVIAHALVVLRVGRVPERASRGAAGHAQVAVERGLAVAVQLLEGMLLEAVELHEKGKHLRAVCGVSTGATHTSSRGPCGRSSLLLQLLLCAPCLACLAPRAPVKVQRAPRQQAACMRDGTSEPPHVTVAGIMPARDVRSRGAARASALPQRAHPSHLFAVCYSGFHLFCFVFAGAQSPSASIYPSRERWRRWTRVDDNGWARGDQ